MGRHTDWVLGIDVGTSRCAGAMGNGSVSPLEVDGNRWMPSMVLLTPEGVLVVGASADHQAGVYPDRLERTPKRHLGGAAPLLLGGEAVEVPRAVSRLIARFADEGRLRRGGVDPSATVLTHPVRWGDDRKAALVEAAGLAGLEAPVLVEEPVAAAVHYVGDQVEVGECVAVYDLGGGTFDTAVLRRTPDGFETIGAPGGDEFIGGEHFDHLVYDFLGSCLADEDPALWEQVQYGEDRRWTRAAADLLTQARRAKEAVSSYPSTQVLLPLVDRDVVVTRAQVEDMIRDQVEETVDEMAMTIASAGLEPADLAAIYLVGGSSRIPLVSQRMTERFGDRIATRDEPKSVVALGAAEVGRRLVGHGGGPASFAVTPASTGSRALTEQWSQTLPADVLALGVGAGAVFATDVAAQVHRIDADGRLRWSAPTPGKAYGAPAAVRDGVFIGGHDGQVAHLDADTGAERFRTATGGPVIAAPLGGDDVVIAADDSSTLSAFSIDDGALRWLLPIQTAVRAPMVRVGAAFLVAGTDGKVYRADVATGAVAWAFPAPSAVTAAPAVVDRTVVIACTDGRVYAVAPETGRASWGAQLDGPVAGAPAAVDDVVLVADGSGWLSAIDLASGTVRWRVETGGGNPTGVVVKEAVAYVDNGEGALVAVDVGSADVVGRADARRGSWHPPVVVGDSLIIRDGRDVRALSLSGG